MGQMIVRNLDDSVVAELKLKASRAGLSLEEYARRILGEAARAGRPSKEELLAEANRIAAMSAPITEPPFSENLIREDRDSR